MRKNLPVTDIEYPLDESTMIVSKTDLKGKLTFFNDQFVKASGFSEQELMGQPHNIVRHPDMPAEAFEDLWSTLKAGKPWTGAVKNRRKNGDYYWVLASATPIWEDGRVTGYMSIRTMLPSAQRVEAEQVYGLIREKKPHRYTVVSGIIRRRTIADHLSLFNGTLKARLTTVVATLALFMLIVGLLGGVSVQRTSSEMHAIYYQRLVPLTQLLDVNNRMQQNSLVLYKAAAEGRAGIRSDHATRTVTANVAAITSLWSEFLAAAQTADMKALADTYVRNRRAFVEQGLTPALRLLEAGKFDELEQHLAGTVDPLFTAAKGDAESMVALLVNQAKGDFDRAERVYRISVAVTAIATIAGVLLGGMLGVMTIRAVGRPLRHLNDLMAMIAKGEFNSRVFIDRDDEAGTALRNLQAMQAKLGYDRVEQAEMERRAISEKKAAMRALADEFQGAVGGIVNTVSSASTELEAAASTLTRTAETTQHLSTSVAAASEQASTNVQSVASATEEMASSVIEISRQVQESTQIARNAVRQAEETNARINQLSQAAARIGDVIKLITSVAEQTNLLALNATIEAARAGEAGRGFAVVASEVKALAAQTANATDEIGTQIASMQSATQESVAAITAISRTIDRISEIAAAIATSVEQQGAATQEISRNVQQAAHGTAEVAGRISEVSQGAGETGSASAQVLASAQSLSSESNHLRLAVDKFLASVRAA
jgi:aerotaxis receptor